MVKWLEMELDGTVFHARLLEGDPIGEPFTSGKSSGLPLSTCTM